MMKLNQAEIAQYHSKAVSLASRARSALQKADEAVDKVVTAAVTGAAAFGFGVAQGRTGGVEVLGIPADLGAGVALHALGFAGVAGRQSDYLHAAGNGALACYLTTLGRGVGVEWKRKADGGASLPAGSSGSLPAAASGSTMSDDELARMASGGAPA